MIVKLPGMLRAGEGAPAAWMEALPEDLRSEPTLKTVPDVPTLAKNYVEAQRMMGSRIPMPQPGWEPKQWDDFYNKVGRPDNPDKYTMPEVKLEEGVTVDPEKLKSVRAKVHGLGLTDRQFKGIMEVYLDSINGGVKGATEKVRAEHEASMGQLRADWGDKFETNLDVAKSVIRKFAPADSKLAEFLEQSRLGDNVEFVKFLHTIGTGMLEDTTRGGELGTGLQVTDRNRALAEIERLKTDKEFQEAYSSAQHPGHDGAIKRWLNLFSVAYPGKSA